MPTIQENFWANKFGDKYIKRNLYPDLKKIDALYKATYGVTRSKMNKEFLNKKEIDSVLEIGCNIGNQLIALQKQGLKNLYGIDINPRAVELAKKYTKDMSILQGSAFDIPFKDNYFDLVFTSGVLIHISPKDLEQAMKEAYRVSKKYIWGFEYHNSTPVMISYRGHKDRLWKCDFTKLYRELFPNLRLVKEKKYKHLDNNAIDSMFLLKKTGINS